MSSRNYPSVRRLSSDAEKSSVRDTTEPNDRRAVCRRCGFVMLDCEPYSLNGQFWHLLRRGEIPRKACPNWGVRLGLDSAEVEPYMRKARRRFLKRRGIRA